MAKRPARRHSERRPRLSGEQRLSAKESGGEGVGRRRAGWLRLLALAALTLAALACNGDDGPTPTATPVATPTERAATETPAGTADDAPRRGAWRTLAPMPTPRSEVAVAAVGGKIYVVGGFEGDGSPSDAVEVYDPVTDTWTQAPPLPEPRHHTAAATRYLFDGQTEEYRLLVIGGYEGGFNDPTQTVFGFSETSGTWTELAPMPTGRGGHALVEFAGSLCAIGGADADGKNVAAVEVYDPVADTWRTAADLPTPRDHLAAAATHFAVGSDMGVIGLYAIGGRVNVDFSNNLDTNDSYKGGFDASTGIRNDAWEPAAPLPTARSGIAAGSTGGRIYVFGGEGSEGTFDENEVYDARTNAWETLEPMPTARHGLGAAVVGDTIYVIGGGETPGLSVSGANEAFTP